MPWNVGDEVFIDDGGWFVLQECVITAIDYTSGFCMVKQLKLNKETVHQIESIVCPHSTIDFDTGEEDCNLKEDNCTKRCDNCPNRQGNRCLPESE